MSLERILFAEPDGLLGEALQTEFSRLQPEIEFLKEKDGMRLIALFARLAKNRRPPVLTVLFPPLRRVDLLATMRCLRGIERAIGWKPTPLIAYGLPGSVLADEINSLGQAVILDRPANQTVEEEAKGLAQILSNLIGRMGGR